MATINLFASPKLFPPRFLQRDNERLWEWEIRAIRAGDPGEGEAKSVNHVTPLDPITSDYIPRGVSARLVVARFYGSTTGFTNCSAFSLSSYLSSLPLFVSYSYFLWQYNTTLLFFFFLSEYPQSLNVLDENVTRNFSCNRLSLIFY